MMLRCVGENADTATAMHEKYANNDTDVTESGMIDYRYTIQLYQINHWPDEWPIK